MDRVFPDVEQRLVAAFDHRRVGRGCGELGVHVVLHVCVRDHGEPVGPAEGRHVEPFLDAGELRDVGLKNVGAFAVHIVAERVERVDRLPHRDRQVERLGEVAVGPHIEGMHRLLEPGDIEFLEPPAPHHRGLQIPDRVHVHHQLRRVANCLSHRLHPRVVLAGIGPAQFHFHGIKTAIQDPLHVGHELVGAPRQPAAVGVVGLHAILAGTEVPPKRLALELELDIPEGEIHRTQAHTGHAHAADEVRCRVHGMHEGMTVERGPADDRGRVALVDHHLGGLEPLGVVPVEAVARHARIRMNRHLHELDRIDARLAVGDRSLPERHIDEHGLHGFDERHKQILATNKLPVHTVRSVY